MMSEKVMGNENYRLLIAKGSDSRYFSKAMEEMMKRKIDLGSIKARDLDEKQKEFLLEAICVMTCDLTNHLIANHPLEKIDEYFMLVKKYIYSPAINFICGPSASYIAKE